MDNKNTSQGLLEGIQVKKHFFLNNISIDLRDMIANIYYITFSPTEDHKEAADSSLLVTSSAIIF